jgi:hypothetical protein
VYIAEVDEVPVLLVALVEIDTAVGLIGNIALFPGRFLRLKLLRVGTRL